MSASERRSAAAQGREGAPAATFASVRGHMARGSAWMLGMRFAIRGLGLVSTLILVRLLTPDDFGVMAMAMLVVGLFGLFEASSQRLALVRLPEAKREHYDTAWTIQAAVGMALAAGVFVAAPLAGLYFGDPRCVDVIRLLSLSLLFGGFENVATARFLKEFDFKRDFRLEVCKKLLSFAVTLSLALAWRSYWALAWGIVAGRLAGVVFGYAFLPYRPRLTLVRWREIWSFALWTQLGASAGFFNLRLDQFAVSSFAPAATMGAYAVANEVAVTPTAEMTVPLSRALFPSYARLQHDPSETRKAFLSALAVIAVICTSLSVGLACVAEDFSAVVLGPQWSGAAELIVWLSLAAGLFAFGSAPLPVLQATGRARTAAAQSWTRIALLAPLVAGASALTSDAEAVAAARTLAVALFLPIAYGVTATTLGFGFRDVLAATWRPLAASAAMAVAVAGIESRLAPGAARLAACVAGGATVYIGCLFALWAAAGRPGGVERLMLGVLRFPRRAGAAAAVNPRGEGGL